MSARRRIERCRSGGVLFFVVAGQVRQAGQAGQAGAGWASWDELCCRGLGVVWSRMGSAGLGWGGLVLANVLA